MPATIEQVENGYIVEAGSWRKVFHTFEEVCQALLGHFEGRYAVLSGDRFGVVVVHCDAVAYNSSTGVGMVRTK